MSNSASRPIGNAARFRTKRIHFQKRARKDQLITRSLDSELQQITGDADSGRRYADDARHQPLAGWITDLERHPRAIYHLVDPLQRLLEIAAARGLIALGLAKGAARGGQHLLHQALQALAGTELVDGCRTGCGLAEIGDRAGNDLLAPGSQRLRSARLVAAA
ncbi:hypothetical protein [Halochromatium sp.]